MLVKIQRIECEWVEVVVSTKWLTIQEANMFSNLDQLRIKLLVGRLIQVSFETLLELMKLLLMQKIKKFILELETTIVEALHSM